jgi:dolichyl-phosphate-mannose-protein mannosyltransferase
VTAPRLATCAAAALALTTLAAGVRWGSTVAGGADSYGYVSEAGLWLRHHLAIEQDLAGASPWPRAIFTWSPLGYVPSADGAAIVPAYPPGLPLLMAAAQAIAGFCAAFLVVPICGALTIWLTYLLGGRLFAAPSIGLAAAVLVAASPVFLFQLMNPMSDVPATAAWTAATLLTASARPGAAGLAAAAAMLIRPNLAPLALPLLAWTAAVGGAGRAIRMASGVALAALAVAIIDARLYGSPLTSGYGHPSSLYAARNALPNARQFWAWTIGSQTPLPLLSLLYLGAPRLSPHAQIARPKLLLGGVAAATIASYLFYEPFDAWWYLRFLLPMWPVMMVMTAAGLIGMVSSVRPTTFVAVVVLAVAVYDVRFARTHAAFEVGSGEQRYIAVARFVAANTEPDAVVVAVQHSGTLRLYADRLTLQFDQLDAAWLDRAVAFLADRGRHPYFVLDGFEEARFRQKFAAANRSGRLDWAPLAASAGNGTLIYDPVDRTPFGATLTIPPPRSPRRCNAPQVWPPRVRMK